MLTNLVYLEYLLLGPDIILSMYHWILFDNIYMQNKLHQERERERGRKERGRKKKRKTKEGREREAEAKGGKEGEGKRERGMCWV